MEVYSACGLIMSWGGCQLLEEFGKIDGGGSDIISLFHLPNILMCTLEIWAALAEVAAQIQKL